MAVKKLVISSWWLLVDSCWFLNLKINNMEYTNLDVWIECRKLTNIVYNSTKTFPKEEIFGLNKPN